MDLDEMKTFEFFFNEYINTVKPAQTESCTNQNSALAEP